MPGPRFAAVRFENYRPNPAFPSQARAREAVQGFLGGVGAQEGWLRRRRAPGRGLYLDGGFGVGKTHLMASAHHAYGGPKAFLSFQELMYLIGLGGVGAAAAAFAGTELLLLDEFELDDPGSTHMVNTFLSRLMPSGLSVVATSNTEPGALGQGRFNTEKFERQLSELSGRFASVAIDGPDYRQRSVIPGAPLDGGELRRWRSAHPHAEVLGAAELAGLLREVHPARFGPLLAGSAGVAVTDLSPLNDQNEALRLVHFFDKLYELALPTAVSGVSLDALFDPTYAHGAFAKKYARCLSRLSEMLGEARTVQPVPV